MHLCLGVFHPEKMYKYSHIHACQGWSSIFLVYDFASAKIVDVTLPLSLCH